MAAIQASDADTLSEVDIAEAREVFCSFDKLATGSVPVSKLGDLMNSLGYFCSNTEKPLYIRPHVFKASQQPDPVPLIPYTLKEYIGMGSEHAPGSVERGLLPFETFLYILNIHVSSLNSKSIDDLMLTYEGVLDDAGKRVKGRHYWEIKEGKVPDGFNPQASSNFMSAAVLRQVLMNVCQDEKLTEDEVADYLKAVGMDSKGKLDYEGCFKKFSRSKSYSGWADADA